MSRELIEVGYLLGAMCFIMALKLMNSPVHARKGNWLAAFGMGLALLVTLLLPGMANFEWIAVGVALGSVVGVISARRVQMTAMPQMVALFNGVGGGAVAIVALMEFLHVTDPTPMSSSSTTPALTFGSTIATRFRMQRPPPITSNSSSSGIPYGPTYKGSVCHFCSTSVRMLVSVGSAEGNAPSFSR